MPAFNETLTDGIISLRPYRMEDLEETFSAVRESLVDLKPWMSWAHDEYSIEETRTYLVKVSQALAAGEEYSFAITSAADGSYIGGCGLNHIDSGFKLCNLGYWVRSSRRGQGFASRAARLVAEFGFKHLDLVRIEIVVAVGNTASLRVAEKTGAFREGTLRNRLPLRVGSTDAVMHSLVPADFQL